LYLTFDKTATICDKNNIIPNEDKKIIRAGIPNRNYYHENTLVTIVAHQ